MDFEASLIRFIVSRQGRSLERRMTRGARQPQKEQEALLQRILRRNAETEYGRAHGFEKIATVEEFRRQVPVNTYEDLRPWIEKQDQTNEPVLTSELPLRYAMTSGTTGKPKFIPVLPSTLDDQRGIQRLFLSRVLKEAPRIFEGSLLSIVSPSTEGYLVESGRPYGSTSGHMCQEMSESVKRRYVVPAELFGIQDYDTKYLAILLLALLRERVTFLASANPSTFVRLAQVLNDNFEALVRMVETGHFEREDRLNFLQRKALRARLVARPERAAELRDLARAASATGEGRLRLRDVFPDLQAVSCWTGGSCRIFLEQLKGEFPPSAVLSDLGYLSSEFRGTVVLSSESNAGVPTFWSNYFEFVEREAWDEGRPEFKGLHELEDKRAYYVFVTTDSGLYRYDMNDVVEVDGFFESTPRLRFVQKGKGVTSITGEKLYESQVIQAVRQAETAVGVRSSFFLAEARPEQSVYRLYFEPVAMDASAAEFKRARLASAIESALSALNLEYKGKRESGRLRALELRILTPGAFERYKQNCLERGQREGQFKIIALQYAKDVQFDFLSSESRHLRASEVAS